MGNEFDPGSAFLALADSLEDFVFVWKQSGEMLWVNRAFVRETGMQVGDFGFENSDNPFIHPEDLPRVLSELAAFYASSDGVSAPIQNRFFDSWGKARSLRSTVYKVTWNGDPALMFVSTLLAAPSRAHDMDGAYRELVEAAEDGIAKLSSDGRIVYSNRRLQQMTGLAPVALAKLKFYDLFEAEGRENAAAALRAVIEEHTSSSFQRKLESSKVWLDVKLSRLNEPDQTTVALAIARDVSERMAMQQALLRREKEEVLSVLVGAIAHDLNNIATGVLANATFAESPRAPAELAQTIADLRLAGERAASLGRSLLSYLGQAPGSVEGVELDKLVRETLRMAAPLVGPMIELSAGEVRSGANIEADVGQLGHVLMNLVTNAAHALGPRGGRISVASSTVTLSGQEPDLRPGPLPAGTYALVRVTDHGSGMSQETLERAFDPFFTTRTRGHGLGLSTSLGILKQHRGALRVKSAVGVGTTFEVLLPVCARERSRPKPPEPRAAPAAASGGTILFVDDEHAIRRLGERVLKAAGYRVLVAGDGQEALNLMQQQRVDAVVLDSTMPGDDGYTVARKMRQLVPDLPIIRSSGYRPSPSEEAEQPGTSFLPKPYTSQALVSAVSAAVGATRSV